MTHPVKILASTDLTHDVRRFVVERPEGYDFQPGQATEVAIDQVDWRDEKRPFTFTSLPNDPNLEFTIKRYDGHHGMTEQLHHLHIGQRILIDDVWGAITYQGPGVFIAGGAGVTPFIAILRQLEQQDKLPGHRLLFSNKTEDDIILREDFVRMLGDDAVFNVTRQPKSHYFAGRIDAAYLKDHVDDFGQHFYVCGPPGMVEDITEAIKDLGAEPESLVLEE